MKYNILLNIAFFFLFSFLKAESSSELFSKANKAYEEKRFDEAAQQYETILKNGEQSANIYYNLGNAKYKSSALSGAILNYEKGLLIQPNHKAIKNALALVKENQTETIDALPGFFLKEAWINFRNKTTTRNWSIIFLLSLFFGFASLIAWLFGKSRQSKQLNFFGALFLLFLAGIFFMLALQSHQRKHNAKEAIVLKTDKLLHKAPDTISETVLLLPEGAKLFIKDQLQTENKWFKVRLLNGETGWVSDEDLGMIRL